MDPDDVGMIEASADRVLGLEELAQPARHGSIVLPEANQLDGDKAVEVWVMGQIDDRRCSLAQGTNDFIFAYFSTCR